MATVKKPTFRVYKPFEHNLLYKWFNWMDDASCFGQNIGTFFLPQGNNPGKVRKAKKICAGCPVRKDCLDFAVNNRVGYGIWGGKTSKERKHLIKQRRTK